MLSELHDKAPVHKWEASKAAIEKAFGLPVEQMFESIDHSAIASGSIAQVRSHPLLLCPNPACVNSKPRLACCALGALATLPLPAGSLAHVQPHLLCCSSKAICLPCRRIQPGPLNRNNLIELLTHLLLGCLRALNPVPLLLLMCTISLLFLSCNLLV